MTRFLALPEAIAAYVHDGSTIALEGFTHLIPFAAGHEIIRQQKRDLTLIRMTPDLVYDQLIGMGCARKLIFSWGGNPGVGSLHRLRDAVENGWPRPLELEEHSHAAMASAYAAGAAGLPCAILRGYLGSDLARVNPNIRFITCPFSGERLAAVPALRPDLAIVHAQRADRQGRRDLTLIRMTPDLVYDQLIGMGCARKLIFSWGGNPGVGSLHRLRDAVENGWPRPLELEEHSHAAMAGAYAAGAAGLPCAILRGYLGSDLVGVNSNIRFITCPFSGERLAAVPALRPDLAIVHAQRADRRGNVLIEGITGVQKEVVLAAKQALVTVEEVVDDLRAPSPNSTVLPDWTVSAIAEAPGGARPSYAHGYYKRDNAFYAAWDTIARDREGFLAWMQEHVLGSRF